MFLRAESCVALLHIFGHIPVFLLGTDNTVGVGITDFTDSF